MGTNHRTWGWISHHVDFNFLYFFFSFENLAFDCMQEKKSNRSPFFPGSGLEDKVKCNTSHIFLSRGYLSKYLKCNSGNSSVCPSCIMISFKTQCKVLIFQNRNAQQALNITDEHLPTLQNNKTSLNYQDEKYSVKNSSNNHWIIIMETVTRSETYLCSICVTWTQI